MDEDGPSDAESGTDAADARREGAEGSDEGAVAPDHDDHPNSEAPLEELATEIRARQEAKGRGAAAEEEELFESVDVDEVDDEAVWESFVEGEVDPEERVGLGAEVEEAGQPHEYVVPKREFCQRCPHFADPPETVCTHEGTTIVEVVEGDRFRVRNCPIVAERDVVTGDRPAE